MKINHLLLGFFALILAPLSYADICDGQPHLPNEIKVNYSIVSSSSVNQYQFAPANLPPNYTWGGKLFIPEIMHPQFIQTTLNCIDADVFFTIKREGFGAG